ncbi:LysR family transcriptional regulator [Vibrio sp. SCSIO 43136]|uniref:LysR family transcriptional regulator n=1 Tax=Vibrio sp. SCSIO 43136 TaxID=2819101 RepID=UPI002075DE21|nr:LysR family transcriptional regulator [Vibrio sp. SCSIO 43136]USD67841.1 LysR family transcriptional regulator [Vibrio sp. SCSIO 43136]
METTTLDGYVVFYQVISLGSFTAAAQKTGHSTSYISKEINKLEDRLGVRLIHRTTRSLNLTPEGEVFFDHCQTVVEEAKRIEQLLSGKQGEPKGRLKISCPVGLGAGQLSGVLAEFAERYPKVQLDVELNDRKVDLVAEGFDIVLRATTQLEDSSLISRLVRRSHGVVIASPAYLAKYGTPKHPTDLIGHRCICYTNLQQPNLWEFSDWQGERVSVTVDNTIMTNSAQMEIAMCLAGQGITRLPVDHVQEELAQGKLVELFEDWPKFPLALYLVYPSRKHMSPKVRSFIEFVIEKIGE